MFRSNTTWQMLPLVRIAVALIGGICIGEYLSIGLLPSVALALSALAVLIAWIAGRRRLVYAQSVMVILLTVLFGLSVMLIYKRTQRKALPDGIVGYEAVVASEPVVRGKVVMVDLLVASDGGEALLVRASILNDSLSEDCMGVQLSDGIIAYSEMRLPENRGVAGFDYGLWLVRHGYNAQTFIWRDAWNKVNVNMNYLSLIQRVKLYALKNRKKMTDKLSSSLSDRSSMAVFMAMTLGDKSALTTDLKEEYSIAGASHVLALSGLHMGILYGFLIFFLRGQRRRWFAQFLLLTTIWTYVLLVGMAASILRAALMLTVFTVVRMVGRESHSANTLAFSAIVMLLANPSALFDAGFQMSFMAVLSILLFVPLLNGFMPALVRRYYILRKVWDLLAVSCAAQVFTAPIVAYYFGRFSTYFLLTNLLAIPCVTVVLCLSCVLFMLYWWDGAWGILIDILSVVMRLLNDALSWVASLPFASIEDLHPTVLQVFLLEILLFICWRICRMFTPH